MKRREREIEQRREDMLKSAQELFIKKGYNGVTIKEIAEKAEFSRITMYSYFKSKMDILVAIIARMFAYSFQSYFELIGKTESNYEKLKMYGLHEYQMFSRSPGSHLLIVQFRQHRLDREKISKRNLVELEQTNNYAAKLFSKIIKEGIEQGEFRCDLDIELSRKFFSKATFAIVHPYVFQTETDLSQLEKELEYLLRAFIPEQKN
ncbi:MAG: hypothetical protein APR63_10025 [Desulfuromonas sp. SDB]|nr:MAG: hypothetical protein APR63_10025 [Desulfuromonas sp. SDB]